MVQISARPKVTIAQTARLFIDILYIAAVVVVRTIKSEQKKKMKFKCAGNVKLCLPWVDVSHYFDQRRRRLGFLRLEAHELKLENRSRYRLAYEKS